MLLLTVILGGAVICLINYWINSQYEYWKKKGIAHSNLTPLKQLYKYLFTKKGIMQIMWDDYKNLEGHKIAGQFQLFTPLIMIRDADLVHRICIKDFSHFVDRNLPTSVSDLFSESLGSVTGDRWRTLRHKMTPTFTSGKLKNMFEPIKECCDEVVTFVNGKIGEDIEARDFLFKFVINTIGNISFGLKVDALNEQTEDTNEFLKVSRSFFKPSIVLMIKFMITIAMPKVRSIIKFSMIDKNIELFFRNLVNDIIAHREKTGEVRNDFLQLMLDQRKKELEDSHVNSPTSLNTSTDSVKEKEDELEDKELLDQLNHIPNVHENDKSINVFTDECIASQTFIFISAGSETVSASLSFVLFELAQNPLHQKKVQEEVDHVVANHGFTYQGLRNMTYTEQVINESMRMHPIAPFLTRVCTENYNIPDTDIQLEKGTVLSIPIIGIMNDPQYFEEPEKFNPDHFEDPDATNPGIALSFGIGPRMCIAKRLAMLEMKMLIAALLQHFTVKLSSKTKLPITIMKSSAFQHVEGGIWVQFERRNKN